MNKIKISNSWLIAKHCMATSYNSKYVRLCSQLALGHSQHHTAVSSYPDLFQEQAGEGENIYFSKTHGASFQLPDSRGFNLDFRKHLRESLQGLLGRGDWFPVQEKRHSHCVALVRVHPAELHHLVLRLEKFFFSSENFTFWGAACSSVGGPMMFSLTKIWTHSFPLIFTKCLSFSLSTNYTLSQNCAEVGSIRPAAKVVHHNCSGFLRVPVKNHHFHWILRRPAFDWDDMTKR